MSIQGSVISLGLQLTNHRVIVSQIATKLGSLDKAQQYLNKCLYYVNIGSNDYINNYFLPQFYPTRLIYSPKQYAEALVEELSSNLLVHLLKLSAFHFCFHKMIYRSRSDACAVVPSSISSWGPLLLKDMCRWWILLGG